MMLQQAFKSILCIEYKHFSLSKRSVGTFTSLTGEQLWNSTSPQARRTGRGKRAQLKKREDFSRNHKFGEGTAGILWPGLNADLKANPIQRTKEEQEQYKIMLEEKAKEFDNKKFKRPVIRGWTGGHYGGVRLGPPESVEGQNFQEFESIVMDVARVSHMNMKQGRVYSQRAIVAVGNFNGLVGVGMATSPTIAGAFRKARQKAVNRLIYVERMEERTVYEDVYVNHHRTWLSIRKQPEGYGLRCHRALKDMCRLIGFRDVYIKVTGSTTMLNLLKCFVKGVLAQETYQQKADRLGLHVVEFDDLRRGYPRVLASPSGKVLTKPYDDYEEYLNQEFISRDILFKETGKLSSFNTAITSDNRGPPTPTSFSTPEFLKKIGDLQID